MLCVDAVCETIISANEMCWGCMSLCCKVFLFNDTLFRIKSLHEIIFVLTIILIIYLNGEECLFGLCFGMAYMPGVYFAYWLYSYFLFQKQIKKLQSDLDQVISKLHTELSKTSLQQRK